MPARRNPVRLIAMTLLAIATPAGAQDMTGWPDWLKTAMAKESPDLASAEVTTDDERFRFMLAGEVTESSAFEGGWYVQADIQSESPVECYIITDATDLATLVNNLAELNIQAQAENTGGPVDNRSIFDVDAGAIDGAPFLAIEWIYTVGEAPNALVGHTKVRAAHNGQAYQACTHNYPGYRTTFADAFTEFIRTTQQPPTAPDPYYEEVVLQSIGNSNVGYIHSEFAHDADGDTQILVTMASLMPIGPGEVAVDDRTTRSWSTPNGLLINTYTASTHNGELVDNLSMTRNEDGAWNVAGQFQGKEIDSQLDGSIQPVSELGQMQAARVLFQGDETEIVVPVWASDADPTRFIDGKITRDDAAVENQGILELGPLSVTAVFDENGSATRATMSVGAITLTMNRIWSNGTIP